MHDAGLRWHSASGANGRVLLLQHVDKSHGISKQRSEGVRVVRQAPVWAPSACSEGLLRELSLRSSQARRRLLQLGNTLALGRGAAACVEVLAVVQDGPPRVVALVLGAVLIPAGMRAAKASVFRRVPIQDGELFGVAELTCAMIPADVERVILRHAAAAALKGTVCLVGEVEEGKFGRVALVRNAVIVPAGMRAADALSFVLVEVQDRELRVRAGAAAAELGEVHGRGGRAWEHRPSGCRREDGRDQRRRHRRRRRGDTARGASDPALTAA
mmetsp:Transcript_150056/g.381446  ORF Transcript_150056/g.381446 Transcript_150056/m.381446 type:complete len:272 (+) Transcript_150056:20-835(+)